MRMPLRALAACIFLVATVPARAAAPIEQSLPDSTLFLLKVDSAEELRQALGQSQFGQMLKDESMKPFIDSLMEKAEGPSKKVQEKIGLTIGDLVRLPQGAIALAVTSRDDAKMPVAFFITIDAGANGDKLGALMKKLNEEAEKDGAKVRTEDFQGSTLNILAPEKKEEGKPDVSLAWTNKGSVYYVSTDVDQLKDILGKGEGRADSLAKSESFQAVMKKAGEKPQVSYYLDLDGIIKLIEQVSNANNNQGQQVGAILQVLGVKNLKAFGGGITFNSGAYDYVARNTVIAPGPAQGILRLFQMPRVDLRPEPWVPATVAQYQSLSWDLHGFYDALNDLINMFAPGQLNALEQNLVGPNGETIKFQKDVFGPLGNRITTISDFKKPGSGNKVNAAGVPDNQRSLFAIALQDAKAFQATLNKVFAMANAAPKKREFQSTTIYDLEVNIPNAPQIQGPISLAIAKETLFISMEPTLLEQVLRGGGAALADNAGFQSVAKEIPEKVSTFTYAKPEESARAVYDMLKSGQLQQAIDAAALPGGQPAPKIGEIFDLDKLPEFSALSKYFTQTGGYWTMDDDGVTMVGFSLRKSN